MECDHRFLVIGDNRNDDLLVAQIQELHGDEVAVEAIAGIREGLHEVAIAKDRGIPYDQVFIDPDLASTTDFKSVLEQLKQFGQEVSVLEPHHPATRKAIARVPDVTIVPKGQEEEFLKDLVLKLADRKKTTGGTTNQIQIDAERIKAKIEVNAEQIKYLKESVEVLSRRFDGFRDADINKQVQFTELANRIAALQNTLLDNQKRNEGAIADLNRKADEITAKQRAAEPEKDIAIARMDARGKIAIAMITTLGTVLIAGFSIVNAIAPQILQKWLGHQEPTPKVSPPRDKAP